MGGVAFGENLAVVQHRDPVGEPHHDLHVVLDDEDRQILGDAAHLALLHAAHREDHARELLLAQAMQEIALIFQRISTSEQPESVFGKIFPGVMPGGDAFRAHAHGVVEEGAELDLGVAEHVRVGRAPGGVLAQEVGEDAVLVLRGEVDRLEVDAHHVRGGGGLWIALGDQAERVSFNRDWYADGDGLSPLELESLMVIDKPDDPAASIHPPSRDHFATGQLANTTQLDIDEARIRQRWLFRQQRSEADTVSALLESGNGQPLVVENYLGQGRVLVQSYPLGLEWSNLPLLKSYVVMIQDWLDYVTAPTIARFNLTPGAPIVVSGTAGAHDAVELVTPRGTSISLVAPDADVAPVYRYSQTWLPGTYRVRFKKGERAERDVPFQVARDESETDLRALSDPERAKLSAAGVGFGTAPAIVSNKEQAAPRREPFWGVLLAALVALLAGELLLSSGLARQRHGLAVSAH